MPTKKIVDGLTLLSNKGEKEKVCASSIHEEEFRRRIMIQVANGLWEGIWDKQII